MTMLRIATRASTLARWQANRVAQMLKDAHSIEVELMFISTQGDERRDVPIHSLGGIGVFVKEVQQAVLDGDADVAVHSAKDLPSTTADGLILACIAERADARDVLIGASLDDIPDGGIVATGSIRRRTQLAALRPDLQFADLRGNIDTRIARAGEFHAIVLAAAGVDRLNRAEVISQRLALDVMMPQVGQGALGVECRADDGVTIARLLEIDDVVQHRCVDAERAFLAGIGGGCDAPVGAHATMSADEITLQAIIADNHGGIHRVRVAGPEPADVGARAAASLLPHWSMS